jgi:hypothetical protein
MAIFVDSELGVNRLTNCGESWNFAVSQKSAQRQQNKWTSVRILLDGELFCHDHLGVAFWLRCGTPQCMAVHKMHNDAWPYLFVTDLQ